MLKINPRYKEKGKVVWPQNSLFYTYRVGVAKL